MKRMLRQLWSRFTIQLMDLTFFCRMRFSLGFATVAIVLGSGCAQMDSKPKPASGTAVIGTPAPAGNVPAVPLVAAPPAYQPVRLEALAAYPLRVDWLMNPTNSAFDTLRRRGEIPAAIQALNGTKVAIQGYVKPLQHDAGGVKEFLLMTTHALCCQTNAPRINEWVHVRMTGPSLPYGHDAQYIVRGELQVGEVMGAGNVVSVYRLTGDEISLVPGTP